MMKTHSFRWPRNGLHACHEAHAASILLAVLLFVGMAGPVFAEPAEMVIVNAPYPPFVMPEGNPEGPGIDMDIAIRALERLGITTRVSFVPFKRVLVMLENGEADLTTTLSRHPERDGYLLWSEPYRSDTRYIFYTRRDSGFVPRSLADLHGKVVGKARGFVFPSAFAEDPAIIKAEAPDNGKLLEMLLERRFDAIIVNGLVGRHELRATGRAEELAQAPFEISTPDDKGTVMGFSKARVHPDLVRRFNSQLLKMKEDGTMIRIEQTYLR